MYARLLKKPLENDKSFSLFSPRGTGKTCLIKSHVRNGLYFDLLLEAKVFNRFLANPQLNDETHNYFISKQ
jgi:hypothetical protein